MPEVTAEIRIDVQVWCAKCGKGLCRQSDGGAESVTVEPCQNCLDQAFDEGKDEGYNSGFEAGCNS